MWTRSAPASAAGAARGRVDRDVVVGDVRDLRVEDPHEVVAGHGDGHPVSAAAEADLAGHGGRSATTGHAELEPNGVIVPRT